MPVYDDQKEKTEGKHDLGVSPDDKKAEIGQLERQFGADSAPEANYDKDGDKPDDSNTTDKQAPKDSETPFRYSNKEEKASRPKRAFNKLFGTKLKRRVSIAIGLGLASIILSILGFLSLLPLKVVSLVNNVHNVFAATTENATERMSENLLDKYIVNKVMPQLTTKGKCVSTVSPACKFKDTSGSSPVSKLYHAWHDDKLEQKLATKYGLVFGKTGNGKYYISTNGQTMNLRNGPDGRPTSIFNFADSDKKGLSRAEVRSVIKDRLNDETLFKRVLFRFTYGKFMERKYGVKRCTVACTPTDYIADKKLAISQKKQAAKAYVVRKVLTPLGESYSTIIGCIIEGSTSAGCSTELEKADKNDLDHEKESGLSKGLKEQLARYAATLGPDSLDDLVKKINEGGEKGVTRYLAKELATKIGAKLGGEAAGEVAGKTASKMIPVVGWILLAAQVVTTVDTAGNTVKYLAYAANSAAAVQLFETYNSAASEIQSGNTDAAIVASLNDSLTTNLSGAAEDRSDMTQTNLYKTLYGGGSSKSTSLASDLLSGTAFAASSSSTSKYLCGDGQPQPANALVCDDSKLVTDNAAVNGLQAASEWLNSNPLTSGLVKILGLIMKGVNVITDGIGGLLNGACNLNPICSAARDKISEKTGEMLSWLMDKVLGSPFTENMSGGRTGDLISAGGDVYFNKACQVKLGCQKLSDQEVADIRNRTTDERQREFSKQSMFARVFDKSSPYSLVSKIAAVLPGDFQTLAYSGVGSLLQNPFGTISTSVASVFSGDNKAFAASQATPDPFGVIQYGYPTSAIPNDPETYWNKNCGGEDENAFNEIVTAWANNIGDGPDAKNKETGYQDKNTGEAVATKPEPCLLIKATVGAVGGMYDTSLLDSADLNSDQDTSSSPDIPGVSDASAQEILQMCKNGTATGKIKIICSSLTLAGIPYGEAFTAGHLTENPPVIGCNSFVNISIMRATEGKYKGEYCSQTFVTEGVKNGDFTKIPLQDVQPGDMVVRESSCGCTSSPSCVGGKDSLGRYGHIAIVVSYDRQADKIVVSEASSKARPSGVRNPMTATWSSNNIFGFTYGIRYNGAGL